MTYDRDVELARQCAAGEEQAWERFVLEYRPILYRAAEALDPSGRARELADSLFGELYGVGSGSSTGSSLLRYYAGRSSLATWLRAVLAQRFVDLVREQKRRPQVPVEDHTLCDASRPPAEGRSRPLRDAGDDLDRARDVQLMQQMLGRAVSGLDARERLRLACYYAQGLTLAETGRVLREHEATVSRQLARTRRRIRLAVERLLRSVAGLDDSQIGRCFASVVEDAGPIDLVRLLRADERKETVSDRST